ncbi:methyltransferase family protein [Sphingobacterium alimentarium]|uniref:Methyltransferase family protein n=1 Tax=Sphingobacterium alimentarium TaxID=797292 RepID=A0A4R3VSU6_9SPHI|nr:class I SAM-dependent methyltransferase [Sphingobacterium alimentarium]TCV08269.1 methyltransferase family protein [Sphingobacterium alimentarium]
MTQEKENLLREIALQLSHPQGPKGVEIADMMHETNIGMISAAIQLLQLEPHDTVLELGHGNGKHIPLLFNQQNSISYCGLEISELMHTSASQAIADLYPEQVRFHLYNGNNLPWQAHTFTKIFTVNTVYFWENPIEMLEEIYRVLQAQGRFCLTFAHKDFMQTLPFTKYNFTLYNPSDIKNIITQTAFRIFTEKPQVEKIKNNAGEFIPRNFTTFVLTK